MRRLRALQTFQLLARPVDVAVERLQLRESGLQIDVLAIARQLILENLARAREIAGSLQLLGTLQRAVDGFRQVLVEHFPDLRLGNDANEVVDDVAVLEQHDRRQAPDADLLRQLLLLVGIHLRELEAPAILLDQAVEDRHELLARAAPRSPEIHQDGRRARRFDHVGHERGGSHCQCRSGFGHEDLRSGSWGQYGSRTMETWAGKSSLRLAP